jgi:hypothetical protein
MAQKSQRKRRNAIASGSPAPGRRLGDMPEDLRRNDQRATPPDSLPRAKDVPSLAADGDNPDHPVHDDDVEDLDSSGFEAEVDGLETPDDEPEFDRAEEIGLLDRKR